MVLSFGFLEFYFYHISIRSKYWGKLYHSNEISNIGLKSWFNPLQLYSEMEHGLSASSHLLSLLPPIKFWYIWSDISGIMGGWLGKVKIIKRNDKEMQKHQKFQKTSKKFQSLLFFEDMLWSEKESPIPSFFSCRRLLPWLISYLYCSRLSAEHLTPSSQSHGHICICICVCTYNRYTLHMVL